MSTIVDLSYINDGKVETFSVEKRDGKLPQPVWSALPSLKDMIVSDQIVTEYAQAITLGVELGLEENPLLGDEIYDSRLNANYPELIPGESFIGGECVFANLKEGEEIPFGSVYKKTMDNLQIEGYGAAFQFSKKARLFATTGDWAETWSRALGRAWNSLRNNLRFYPIVSATLEGASATGVQYRKADYSVGTAQDYLLEPTVYATLAAGIKAAKAAKRPVQYILCNSADEDVIREAVNLGYIYGNNRKVALSTLGIRGVIVYDSETLTVGGETTTYTGVTAGTCFLIRPKLGFFERRKQDLLIDTGEADKSRLIDSEIVADGWLGVYAAVANNVQKCTIPTS